MKTIILLIALILCNLSFGCVILPNGNYIPCETNTTKILIEKRIKEQHLKQIGYYEALIENKKIIDNIEYNVKLAESRLNEAEVKYVESIKKYKTTLHNANSKSFIKQKVYSEIAKQKAYSDIDKQILYSEMLIAKQNVYSEMIFAKQQVYSEMITAKFEYEKARRECGRIYALAKGESASLPVGKSPREIFELVK